MLTSLQCCVCFQRGQLSVFEWLWRAGGLEGVLHCSGCSTACTCRIMPACIWSTSLGSLSHLPPFSVVAPHVMYLLAFPGRISC